MRHIRPKTAREPTIALINIVFLMLIFFLVAGSLAAPLDTDLRLVRAVEVDSTAPADALVLHVDGRITYRGMAVPSTAEFVAALPEDGRARVRIIPDRDVPAAVLIAVGRALRDAGAESVVIVTEQGLD